ncbi:MAG TPA: hypothetical protein VHQ65_05275 [Thermoanaerobaculia bacterium]|nr:hypothetical protein [Thermoanaerobaculia bacterium]
MADGTTTGRVEQALRLLTDEVRERVARHPSGHLAAATGEVVQLSLALPAGTRQVAERGRVEELVEGVTAALATGVEALLAHRAAFRPGAVYCLRCGGAECAHARPAGPREVFAGYGKTGLPRFLDFTQLLLERGDPRVDRLYDAPPALLAHTLAGRDLTADLLDAYRGNPAGYRLHGQVAAGWYLVPGAPRPEPLALSFQVISTRPAAGGGNGGPGGRSGGVSRGAQGRARRRYGLNVLGSGPAGEPLEHLYERLGGPGLPWTAAVREAQGELDAIERAEAEPGGNSKAARRERGAALAAVLDDLARRLEKDRRSRDRKTRHAQERHQQGDRPTGMALADLARAAEDAVLVDRQRDTLVVLGERGRAHVFSTAGKLVTSIRYSPESIERRRRRDLWRPAAPEEIAALRERVTAGEEPSA